MMLKSNTKNTKNKKEVFPKKKIYLDNASATPLDKKVLASITSILKEVYANSSSIHSLGVQSNLILEKSRFNIANILGAHTDEIIFTSGATESNNLAILGVLNKNISFILPHIITTNIEHSSILELCRYLEKTKKAEVTYVEVEKNGIVDVQKIKKAIKENTVLVSVMYANNEIGTIQPIREISKIIRFYKKNKKEKNPYPLFHTDAVQAVNYLPIKVEQLGIDLLSLNGGKIYGPKGIGLLYVKRHSPINKILFGGNQEFNLRAGTENLANIHGLTVALEINEKIKIKEIKRLLQLRNYFIENLNKIKNLDLDFIINGDLENRLPNNINISISKIPSPLLILELSARGIYISEKSACKSGEKEGSYVIKALRDSKDYQNTNSIRFSLGRETTKDDINYTLKILFQILQKLKKWYN